MQIKVTAECYNQDVLIEGLPTSSAELDVEKSYCYVGVSYELDFGSSFVNRLQRRSFKIANSSEGSTYKFEFSSNENVIFTPRVGHLKPKTTKDVVATFLSKTPISFEKVRTKRCYSRRFSVSFHFRSCWIAWCARLITSILKWVPCPGTKGKVSYSGVCARRDLSMQRKMSTHFPPPFRYMSHLNLFFSSDTSEVRVKSIEDKGEPAIEVIKETIRAIPIFLSVKANYCSYECNVSEITFADTFLYDVNRIH